MQPAELSDLVELGENESDDVVGGQFLEQNRVGDTASDVVIDG